MLEHLMASGMCEAEVTLVVLPNIGQYVKS